MRSARLLGRSASAILLVLVATACTSPTRFRQPITNFEEASVATAEAFKASLLAANQVERDLAIFRAARVEEPLGDGADVFFAPTFSLEGIGVRLEALQAIDLFAKRLKAVAESSVGTETASAIGSNVSNFNGLAARIDEVANAGIDTASLSALTSPVGTLVGLIARLSIEQRQEQVIADAVRDAEGPIVEIIGFMKEDARAFERLRRTADGEMLARLVLDYNTDIENGALSTESARRKRLNAINKQAVTYQSTVSADVAVAFNQMEQAYKALAEYARTPDSDIVFGNLIQSIDIFLVRADIAYDAARKLQEALEANAAETGADETGTASESGGPLAGGHVSPARR